MDASAWDARYAADGYLWTSQPNRFLVEELGGASPGRALDVACGEGRNAVWLATRGWHVTAIDHSEVGLSKAKELAEGAGVEVDWVLGDVTTYHPDPTYDLVAVLYLHLPRTEMALALSRACEGVGPGGTLFLVGHHPDNIEHGIGGPQLPDVLFGPDDIEALLVGVDVTRTESGGRPVERAGVTEAALGTIVVASRPPGR